MYKSHFNSKLFINESKYIFYKIICRELNLRSEEDRCSKMREELLTLREDLNKAYLAKDMLEQQKLETDGLISQIEKNKGIYVLIYSYIIFDKLYTCYIK